MDDNKPSLHGTGWIVPKSLTRTPQESTDLQLGRFTWCQMTQLISRERPPCLLMGQEGAGGGHQALHSVRGTARWDPWHLYSSFPKLHPPSFCLYVEPNQVLSFAWLILIFQYIITNDCQNNPLDHWTVNLIWSPTSHLVIVLILMTK